MKNSKRLNQTIGALMAALVLALGVTATKALAYDNDENETVTVASSYFRLEPGQTKSLRLDGWRQVKKIFVEAEATGSSDARFDVITNGDVKGTVHVPGYDPSYVITIGEKINSIEFRHLSGGAARIKSVKVVQELDDFGQNRYRRYFDTGYYYDASDYQRWGSDYSRWPVTGRASAMALRAMDLVDALEGFVNYNDYGKYFLPIKKNAGVAYSIARARGDISLKVRTALVNLKDSIGLAIPYVENHMFEVEYAFRLAVELDTLYEELDSVLRN